jgi:two-component system sensor histidine kinase/response regulator
VSGRLLIVDDEVAHMRALCETLELEGFRPTGFSSAPRALKSIRPGEYELLLTDLMMPELDGIALFRAARALDPDLAGVIMTGHGTIDTAVTAMQTGALDYVLKPVKLNAILGVIHRALEIRQLRVDNAALQRRELAHAAELAAAYRSLESFSYSISHDLRAPLRAVRGYAEILQADFAAALPDEGLRLLREVIAGGDRMDRLIEDLLKFCRLSRVPLTRRSVDMAALARRVAATLQSGEPARQVELRIAELPPCEADPSLLEQVMVNLLSNAFKFTRDKVPARIEIDSVIAQDARHGTPECVYSVRDNGAGFDMKYADKLFGVFQRLHSTERFAGTGVGLSIVQSIVQRHGGRIWAESAPDQGATFHFCLGGAAVAK